MKLACTIILIALFFFKLNAQSRIDSSAKYLELKQQVETFFQKGDIDKAIKIAELAVSECIKENGKKSIEFTASLNELALLNDIKGNYDTAEKLYLEVIMILKSTLSKKKPDYATAQNNLALLYYKIGNYNKAEALFSEVLEIRKETLGEEHPDYASSLNDLALLYFETGDYINAERNYIKAINIRGKILSEDNPDYATSLHDLAVFYSEIGNYEKAENYCLKALSIFKKVVGEDHLDYSYPLNLLASVYQKKGIYDKAENLFIQALNIRKNTLGEESVEYASALNLLALLYIEIGDYEKSERLLIKTLNIRKRILGEQHPDYAISMNNLASMYDEMGNNLKAEFFFIQALSVFKKTLGEKYPGYVSALSNIACLYNKMGNYSKAEEYFLEALSIRKKVLGEENPHYATSLSNLAGVYFEMGLYTKAELLFIQAATILKNHLGEEDFTYSVVLKNLADLYSEMGNYANAKSLFMQVINISERLFGIEHIFFAENLSHLANNYEKSGEKELASNQYSSFIPTMQKNFRRNVSFLSSYQFDLFVKENEFNFEVPLSFLARHSEQPVKKDLFNFNLFIKSILVAKNYFLEQAAYKTKDSNTKFMWLEYKSLRLLISRQLQLGSSEKEYIHHLTEKADSLEKELMIQLPLFREAINKGNFTWQNLKSNLNHNEAVLDFVSFKYHDGRWTDTTKVAVFILRPEWSEPYFINLFNEDQLASLFDNSNSSYSINNLYCGNNGATDTTCNSTLYKLIWQPLDSLLQGVKKVYISPSGLLNRVSFSAISTPEGGRLIDLYSIEQLSNIRTIAETNASQEDSIKSMTLIGGANFDAEPIFSDKSNLNYISTDTLFSEIRTLRGGKWSYLVGTENEVNAIKNIAAPSKITMNLLIGRNASEEGIKKIGSENATAPSVIHIATHGFAITTPKKVLKDDKFILQDSRTNVFRMSEDPLTRAGLVMAGGNEVWTTGLPYPNHEDGILTAREVSELNLNGCILATLSACETGLGEIMGSEGVFGLQRAFKMAGVKYLIVSLWKVPDAQTTEFMKYFYSSWLIQKLPIREAFRQTQITMSKKYSPFQWAAFVLVE